MHTHTHARTNSEKETENAKVREREKEKAGRAKKTRSQREREKRESRGGTGTVCQSDAQSCGVHRVTHTTERLSRPPASLWEMYASGAGSGWLIFSMGRENGTGNYYCIMLASCTRCMHTYCTEREN